MQRPGASIAALTLLILAVLFQIPQLHDMAIHKAQHLLRQSTPFVNSARGVLPHNINILPAAFLSSSSSSSSSTLHKQTQQQSPLQRQFTTTSSTMAESKTFLDATESRRTYYQLTTESTISDARIKELVTHTIKHVPSAFNSQTTRMVVVLKEKHEELWDAVMEVYKASLPADKFEHAKGRMTGFRKAYGTVG